MRAFAAETLSEISASSGPAEVALSDRSSTPLPIAPSGLIRSWQIREPISADRSVVFDIRAELSKGRAVTGLNAILEPGMLVRHPGRPDWGLGQVQSRIGARITVNFEHAGKVVIDGDRIALVPDRDA